MLDYKNDLLNQCEEMAVTGCDTTNALYIKYYSTY